MTKISRRGLVKGLLAGAVVLGFDPRGRSWVTEAWAGTGFNHLPPLDGQLLTDPTSLAAAADDWGHIVHNTPVAVLYPGSVNDIVTVINFARANGIPVAGRGQAHTPYGQSQALAGVVINTSTLDTIHMIGPDRAIVDAGVLWRDLLLETTAQGLTPPVLTDYTALSIGGTLSVGGVGGTSHQYGAQVDNVIELEVVTGKGQIVTCSPCQNADLFDAALAGLGLCAIIVRATIRLVPVGANARNYTLVYTDVPTLLADMRTLIGGGGGGGGGCGGEQRPRVDYVEGQVVPGTSGWTYVISAAIFYDSPSELPSSAELLQGLSPIPGSLTSEDSTYFAFTDSVYQLIQELGAAGLNALPHPWIDLFVPGSSIDAFATQTIASLDPSSFLPGSLMLFYPFRRDVLQQPLFAVPDEEIFFLFDVLRTSPPDPAVVSAMLAQNRGWYDENVALGGKSYTISAVQLSPQDWKKHFQPYWSELVSAKHKFDPSNVLGPGPGVFS
jgi:cytokinin dehydrogenase